MNPVMNPIVELLQFLFYIYDLNRRYKYVAFYFWTSPKLSDE